MVTVVGFDDVAEYVGPQRGTRMIYVYMYRLALAFRSRVCTCTETEPAPAPRLAHTHDTHSAQHIVI